METTRALGILLREASDAELDAAYDAIREIRDLTKGAILRADRHARSGS